jgi:hypothetical protein
MFMCRIFTIGTVTDERVRVWAFFASSMALRNKSGEALHEQCKSSLCFLVDHFPLAVERVVGAGDHHPATEPGSRPKCPQDRKPRGLRQCGASLAGSCPDNSHWAAAKHFRNVFRRSGQPIDGIL